jgi:hypothetical protein
VAGCHFSDQVDRIFEVEGVPTCVDAPQAL